MLFLKTVNQEIDKKQFICFLMVMYYIVKKDIPFSECPFCYRNSKHALIYWGCICCGASPLCYSNRFLENMHKNTLSLFESVLGARLSGWPARLGSNQQSLESESNALSIVLRAV